MQDDLSYIFLESDEVKKKMYSCIVVLGAGFNFEGLVRYVKLNSRRDSHPESQKSSV